MNKPSDFSKVQHLEIDAQHAQQRLDNFLISYFKKLPKSRIYRLIRKGEVRVNKGRCKVDQRLQVGDQLRIPPVRDLVAVETVSVPTSAKQRLADCVCYQDDDFLIVNKPAGMAVHPGSGQPFGVIEVLQQMGADRDGWRLVHRLDKDTSGCLLIAKNLPTLRSLQQLFQSGGIEKTYHAVLVGKWRYPRHKIVEKSLLRNQLQSGERMVQVDEMGKSAHSEFHLQQQYRRHCTVRVAIQTGRTHQIRVHAAALGLPVLGDDKYGDRQANRLAAQHGLKRMCLHAEQLRFIHPIKGEPLVVQCSLDPVIEQWLASQRKV